jgi:hypothetical protein
LTLIRFQAVQKGDPVTDLRPEDIEVRADNNPQEIAFFQGGTVHPRTTPIELSLLFDCNLATMSGGAMGPTVFEDTLLKKFPDLSIAIYGFIGGPVRLTPLTRNPAELNKAVSTPTYVHPVGTFLQDHIASLTEAAAATPGPAIRMLVVFSEREPDQGSTTSAAERERTERTVEVARETGVAIYPILLKGRLQLQNLETPPAAPRTSTVGGPEFAAPDPGLALRAVGDFTALAPSTGGKRMDVLSGGSMLPNVLEWLGEQMQYEYIVGIEIPASGGAQNASVKKKRHKVKVVMRDKKRGKIKDGNVTLVY